VPPRPVSGLAQLNLEVGDHRAWCSVPTTVDTLGRSGFINRARSARLTVPVPGRYLTGERYNCNAVRNARRRHQQAGAARARWGTIVPTFQAASSPLRPRR